MNNIEIFFFIYNNKSDRCMLFLEAIDYPKDKLSVTVFSDREFQHNYKHVIMPENEAWNYMRLEAKGDYVWAINGDYVVQSTSTLRDLLKTNLNVVSALLVKPKTVFSNFWGALTDSGWYARSDSYLDIVNRENTGLFEVPYITGNLLIKTDVLKKVTNLTLSHNDWDLDMNICHNLREAGEKLQILNSQVFGHIEETNVVQAADALAPWIEETYLHKDFLDFYRQFEKNRETVKTDIFKEVGPDIWQIPFFTPEFCDHLVAMAEKQNEWSGGVYSKKDEIDPRIGAVEEYPTQDIHLKQMGLHDYWLTTVVGKYYKAILSHLYQYSTKGYNIAFIVKYHDQGQTKLDPHHDASAYTTNIALNTYGEDYTGGGCRFVHKNIECIGNPKGHLILHPGRITHYHEAYPVKSGTRYILVSFNN